MPTETPTSTDRIWLKATDPARVWVEPEDEDRFSLSMPDAIDACKANHSQRMFEQQFKKLLQEVLPEWIHKWTNKVGHSFVTATEGGLLFIVVRKDVAYDPEFTDGLTDLDLSVAQSPELDLITLDTLALPNCPEDGYESFFGVKTWEYR